MRMKRFLFIGILFALCLHFNRAHAQRYLPGMKGLQVTAGMADGVHWNSIPVEQFTAEGGYYLKFLSDRRKIFFLSAGLSALAGYETSNRSEKLLPDDSTLLDKDCFIYGGVLTLELEAYLTDRVALLLNARERMLFGSDIGKFHTQVGIGLKFIIN